MNGTEMIQAERQRQMDAEGWSLEHDDEHSSGELGHAAIAYLIDHYSPNPFGFHPGWWPWTTPWWKPDHDDPVRQLVKAGALIAAEIDRLLRDAMRTNPQLSPDCEVDSDGS